LNSQKSASSGLGSKVYSTKPSKNRFLEALASKKKKKKERKKEKERKGKERKGKEKRKEEKRKEKRREEKRRKEKKRKEKKRKEKKRKEKKRKEKKTLSHRGKESGEGRKKGEGRHQVVVSLPPTMLYMRNVVYIRLKPLVSQPPSLTLDSNPSPHTLPFTPLFAQALSASLQDVCDTQKTCVPFLSSRCCDSALTN
jgi:signal recognition particle GTPase